MNYSTIEEVAVKEQKGGPSLGLKRLRKVRGNAPTHKCDNCRCMRYSKCHCIRKQKG